MLRGTGIRGNAALEYGDNSTFYTLKLHHGGMIQLVGEKHQYEYNGGTHAMFDFVPIKRTTMEYLDELSAKLGYKGVKKFYGLWKNGSIQSVEGKFDIEQVFKGHKNFEITMWLVCEKATIGVDQPVTVEGVQDEHDVEVEQYVEDKQDDHPVVDDSDSDDAYFTASEDSGDNVLDDIIFEENVDNTVEYAGITSTLHGNENSESSDDLYSGSSEEIEEENSVASSDGENKIMERQLVFRSSQINDPQFFLEQIFASKALFREAVQFFL